MIRRLLILPLFAGLWGTLPAQALDATLYDCQMGTECFGQETCAATQFELLVERNAGHAAPFRLITSAQTIDGVFRDDNDPNGATYFIARVAGGYSLLSILPDGAANWSVHLSDAGTVITYFGQCEGDG